MKRRRNTDTIEVEFAAGVQGLAETFPIQPTRKFIPDWWKQMSRVVGPTVTPWDPGSMKTCPAIIDVLAGGWVLPLACDVYMNPTGPHDYEWQTAPGALKLLHHPANQAPGMPLPAGYAASAVKLDHHWSAKTPPGYSLRINPVPLSWDPPFECFSAIVDTDSHHHLIPVYRYRWCDRGEQVIRAGTPMCHLTLVNRRDEKHAKAVVKSWADIEDGERVFERRVSVSMGGIAHSRRLFRGGYKAHAKAWREKNGVDC